MTCTQPNKGGALVSEFSSNEVPSPEESVQEERANGSSLSLPFNGARHGAKRQLKPIPTEYKGCLFRSLLEARWAAFWDHLAIEWHYEHESFILAPFGEWYRPDFYLPQLAAWIEVKPTDPDEDAQWKTYLFNYCLSREYDSVKSKEWAFVLHGGIPWPYPEEGNIIGYSASPEDEGDPTQKDLCFQMCPMCQQILIGQINTMACQGCKEELGTLLDDALDSVEGIPVFEQAFDIVPAMVSGALSTAFFRSGHKAQQLQEAYAAARSAWFDKPRRRRSA